MGHPLLFCTVCFVRSLSVQFGKDDILQRTWSHPKKSDISSDSPPSINVRSAWLLFVFPHSLSPYLQMQLFQSATEFNLGCSKPPRVEKLGDEPTAPPLRSKKNCLATFQVAARAVATVFLNVTFTVWRQNKYVRHSHKHAETQHQA